MTLSTDDFLQHAAVAAAREDKDTGILSTTEDEDIKFLGEDGFELANIRKEAMKYLRDALRKKVKDKFESIKPAHYSKSWKKDRDYSLSKKDEYTSRRGERLLGSWIRMLASRRRAEAKEVVLRRAEIEASKIENQQNRWAFLEQDVVPEEWDVEDQDDRATTQPAAVALKQGSGQ